MDDLIHGEFGKNLTNTYINNKKAQFEKLTDEVVERINKNLYNGKEVKVFKDNWEEQQEKIKKYNIG